MDYTAVKRTEPPVDDVREEKEGCFSRLRYRCGAFDQGRRQGCCWIVAFMVLTAIFGGLFNNKNNEDLPFFGEQNLTVPSSLFPLKIPLGDPLQIGQYYHIYGNVSKSATDFCFSLTQDVDVRLKICALFSNGTGENSTTTYQALRKNGTLINEISVNPFEKNEVFDLRIRFLDGLVQIFANHGEIGIFTASDALLNATEATLSTTSNGIQSLRLFRIEGRKYENPFNGNIRLNFGQRLDISAQPIMRMANTSQIAEIFDEDKPMLLAMNGTNGNAQELSALNPTQVSELLEKGQVPVKRSVDAAKQPVNLDVEDDFEPEFVRVKRRSGGGRGGGGGGGRGGSRGSSAARSSSRGSSGSSSSSRGSSSARSFSRGSSSSRLGSRFKSSGGSSGSSSFYSQNRRWYGTSTHYYGPSSYSYIFAGRIYYRSSIGCYSCHSRYTKQKVLPRSKRIDILFFNEHDVMTFTVSIRFVEDRVVLNTFKDGEWQHHIREEMPIDDWKIFDLSILKKEKHLAIYFNAQFYLEFEHRGNVSQQLDKVRIDGDVEIHSIAVDGRAITPNGVSPLVAG